MKDLILPLTYEEINNQFASSDVDVKMMEFVAPLIDTEEEISLIAKSIRQSGKLSFILGSPGVGKSTFLHTLHWRSHIPIRKVIDIDANDFLIDESLNNLFDEISRICEIEKEKIDAGVCAIVINYLESLDEYSDSIVKSFFRRLNGLLRNNPILILWPVTEKGDVDKMLSFTEAISGTLYKRDKQIIEISGPSKEDYIDIAKSTIRVLNDGSELSDFGLTNDDLLETFNGFSSLPEVDQNLREYYARIVSKWEINSKYLEGLKSKIPKPTEVWVVFPFKEAESLVNQFARKGNRIEDAWTAISDKFADYITGNNQRSNKWDSKRLQLALHGAIKTRIIYLPTNLIVTSAATFTDNDNLKELIDRFNPPGHWKLKTQTKTSLKKSPIYKQLIGEQFPPGKRKGGPVLQALNTADPIYREIVKWISSGGSGSDTHLNKAIGRNLTESGIKNVRVEKEHPWIKNVFPDIQVDLGHKIICIEFHYTAQDEPHVIADYTLKKLDIYMSQIEKM